MGGGPHTMKESTQPAAGSRTGERAKGAQVGILKFQRAIAWTGLKTEKQEQGHEQIRRAGDRIARKVVEGSHGATVVVEGEWEESNGNGPAMREIVIEEGAARAIELDEAWCRGMRDLGRMEEARAHALVVFHGPAGEDVAWRSIGG